MSTNSRKSSGSTSSKKTKKNATYRIRSFMHKKTNEIFVNNQALVNYITKQEYAENKKIIERFCRKQALQSMTLSRGHMNSPAIRKNLWFSPSKSKTVAKEEFAGKTCCVFTIHVLDVPILDVNKYVKKNIGKYADEQEVIVLGGGTFYKNQSLTEVGFKDVGQGEFICWYTIKKPEKKTSHRDLIDSFVDQIPEEEYEFIHSPSDIIISGISDAQRVKVFGKIKKRMMSIPEQ